MAFETIRGEAGVDFIGTDGIDVLFSINETGSVTVDAKGGNDDISVSSSTNVVGTVTIKAGAGNDVIRATDNGNVAARFASADVKGGAGNDTILSSGAVTSVLRGNEGEDTFDLVGNYTNTTVNGNSGSDTFGVDAAGLTISNTKVLGGSGDDGAMDFTNGALIAVDSTINGSKGVDNISIGQVTTAVNFTVFGGQGNDVITSLNDGADSVVYSGDKGDDTINTTGGNAQTSILGGEGDDVIFSGNDNDTIDGGEGDDIINAGADHDVITGGEGNDTIDSQGGNDTINAGAGADTITIDGADENVYVYSSVADSSATLSGTTSTFDSLTGADFGADEEFDVTAVATQLIGASAAANDQVAIGVAIDVLVADNVNNFAQLRTFINNGGGTVASGANGAGPGQISLQTITVADGADDGDISGTYFILNNSNEILDSGDMMFEVVGVATAAGFEGAIEAAF